jgi:AraC-like DNA-binding protein
MRNTDPATDVARIDLSCGSFDALNAVDFARVFPPHFHDTFAIGVIESGASRLRTKRGEWFGGAGTILAFSPREIHSAEPVDARGWTYRMIYPSTELMREIGIDVDALDAGAPLFDAPVIDDPTLARDLVRAHAPLMDGSANPGAESQLIAALRTLASRHAIDLRSCAAPRRAESRLVDRARTYLHDHVSDQVRLNDLSDVCGASAFHLIRVFRRVVGVSPYAYLIQLRVNRAQVMLCRGATPADAAYACGFSDQSHLTRTFKKVIGVPPGKYLRSVRHDAA